MIKMNKHICETLINEHSDWGYDQNDVNYSFNSLRESRTMISIQ